MKKIKLQNLPFFTLAAGLLGFILQLILQSTGVDEKGLLITGHFAGILLYILTALVLGVLLLAVRKMQNISRYNKLFPASPVSFAGCILAAAGIAGCGVFSLLQQRDIITVLTAVLAVAATVCLVLLGLCRKKGKQPSYLLHACVTAYLMLQLVTLYRHWSPEPQLLQYFFPLLGAVFLMLTAYQAACLDDGKGSRRWYVVCNQAAVFFCCVSLLSEYWLLYLAMGVWAHTNLCTLRPVRSRPAEPKEA